MRTDKARPEFVQEAVAFIVPCCLRLILKCCGRYVIFTVAKEYYFYVWNRWIHRTRERASDSHQGSVPAWNTVAMTPLVWLPSRRTVCALSRPRGRIANLEEKIKEEGGDIVLHLRYRPHPLGNARRAVRPQLASASGRQGQGMQLYTTASSRTTRSCVSVWRHTATSFKSETDTETGRASAWTICYTGKQEDLAQTVLQAAAASARLLRTGRRLRWTNRRTIVAARRRQPAGYRLSARARTSSPPM